jgi:hypothetical protein
MTGTEEPGRDFAVEIVREDHPCLNCTRAVMGPNDAVRCEVGFLGADKAGIDVMVTCTSQRPPEQVPVVEAMLILRISCVTAMRTSRLTLAMQALDKVLTLQEHPQCVRYMAQNRMQPLVVPGK